MIKRLIEKIKELGLKGLIEERIRLWKTKRYEPFIRSYIESHPIEKGTIVFSSRPDYSDNGKALSEYMRDNGFFSKYKVYWLVEDAERCKKLYPDAGVTFLTMYDKTGVYNRETLMVYLRMEYVLATHVFYVPKMLSNPKQSRFLLWHGCGFKDKGWTKFIPNNFDKVCVSGPLFIKTKMKYWCIDEDRIIAKGYPRYDWMRQKGVASAKMAEELKGGNDKLIIWMPTFRNAVGFKEKGISSFPLMAKNQDWNCLDEYCKANNVMLLVKLHIYQNDYHVDFSRFSNIKRIANKDFEERGVNMYEFLPLTDGLISDYSSVAVDYILTDKPIAFALDDFEQYKSLRGFVFDDPRIYMPGHKLYNLDDLMGFIEDCAEGKDTFKEEREKMLNVAIHQSDNYCQEIMEALGFSCAS